MLTLAFHDRECVFDGTVVDARVAVLPLPGQAQGFVHGRMGHLDRQVTTQNSRFARIDAGEIVTHDAW